MVVIHKVGNKLLYEKRTAPYRDLLKHGSIKMRQYETVCRLKLDYYSYNIKEGQTGKACSTHGGREKEMSTRFWWQQLKEKYNAENLRVDGKVISE